jgi:2-dehydropantoate 2-reductase
MKIAIVGTGGVGGYFGGKLQQAGNEVIFIARGKHMEAIRENGLHVKSISGDFHIQPVNVTDKIASIPPVELVIIAVKAWQVKEVALELFQVLPEDATVLPLQNGVLATEELAGVLGPKRVVSGLCRILSMIEAPGIINHKGVDPVIIFGEYSNEVSTRVTLIKEVFDKAEINSKIAKDIQSELWKKYIAICVSGLLAVSRSTYGEVRTLKETRTMMYDLMYEIYLISKLEGVNIPPDFVDRAMEFIDTFPPGSTSSLTRDVWEGKPSEIEYQNGTVVKLSGKHNIDTPVNRFVYNCILPQERRARGLI